MQVSISANDWGHAYFLSDLTLTFGEGDLSLWYIPEASYYKLVKLPFFLFTLKWKQKFPVFFPALNDKYYIHIRGHITLITNKSFSFFFYSDKIFFSV